MRNTVQEYAQKIADAISGRVVLKNSANGIVHTGVTKYMDTQTSPVVYVDDLYEKKTPVDEAVDFVQKKLKQGESVQIDPSIFLDYLQAADKLTLRMFHKSTVADLSFSAKEYGFDDLILVPYIITNEIDSDVTLATRVPRALLELWGVSKNEVFRQALNNIDLEYYSLAEIFRKKGIELTKEEEALLPPLIIITNGTETFGASSVIKARPILEKMFPSGYAVLPSSVHECIVCPMVVPQSEIFLDRNELKSLVQEVNSTSIHPEEKLSDNVYIFP